MALFDVWLMLKNVGCRYGGIAYFEASSQRLMGIWISYKEKMVLPPSPNSENVTELNWWQHGKWWVQSAPSLIDRTLVACEPRCHLCRVWKSSMTVTKTGYHLNLNHWLESESITVATMMTLPKSHNLRAFLKPFMYDTAGVNDGSA